MSENDPMACPRCRQPLPGGAPEGLCPRCLGALNLDAPTDLTGLDTGPSPRQSAPSPEEIGPHFPNLEIIRCLGRGGMGVVYEAHQKSLDRRVALKILAPGRERDPAFTDRFLREARLLARLNHPNIVTVYEFGESAGHYYLLMEFVEGVNLRQLLTARKITPEEALAIVPPICEALQYAHEHGVVHQDIKPENLLLDKQGRVKIADFGVARLLGQESGSATEAAGTPQYMAPEQRDRPQTADHRADIYSLGVVFYEMLTGELPTGRFPSPSSRVRVDVRLDEIVLRALEREPERRYQTATEFRTQVETVPHRPVETGAGSRSTAEPTRASVDPPTSPALPNLNHRRWAQLGFGLLLAGTLGTLVLMTLSPRHELALIFAGAALLLALVLGIKSWSDRLGKTVTISTASLFAAAGLTGLILTGFISVRHQRIAAEAERARARERLAMLEAAQRVRQEQADSAKAAALHQQVRVLADGTGDFPTIQAALDAAPENALISVGPGRFPQRLDIRKSVRIEGAGWDQTTIGVDPSDAQEFGGDAPSPPLPTVRIQTPGAVQLSGLRLTEPGFPPEGRLSPQAALDVTGAQTYLLMKDCAVVGGPGNGVVFGDRTRGTLRDCLVAALWNTGIVIGSGSSVSVEGCDIRNCHYAGIIVRRGARAANISSNRISGAAWHGIRYDDTNPLIVGNLIFGNARSGIYASGVTQSGVRQNVFFDNEMNGMSCWFNNQDAIAGNTFVNNQREGLSILGSSAPTIVSNIFSGHPVALYQGMVNDPRASAQSLGNPTVQRNLFWQNGTNWIRWQPAAAGQEPQPEIVPLDGSETVANPGFVDAEKRDFSLAPGSSGAQENIGAARPLSWISPWPLQKEERAIIPDGPTRDSRQWKRVAASD